MRSSTATLSTRRTLAPIATSHWEGRTMGTPKRRAAPQADHTNRGRLVPAIAGWPDLSSESIALTISSISGVVNAAQRIYSGRRKRERRWLVSIPNSDRPERGPLLAAIIRVLAVFTEVAVTLPWVTPSIAAISSDRAEGAAKGAV